MIACLPRLFAWSKDKENNALLKNNNNNNQQINKKQRLLHNNGMNSDVVKSKRKKKDTEKCSSDFVSKSWVFGIYNKEKIGNMNWSYVI